MMMDALDHNERGRWADRLSEVQGRLGSGPAAMADARAVAEALLEQTAQGPLGSASQRLSAMVEVWECLGGEDASAAAEVEAFCGRVLECLAEGLRQPSGKSNPDWILHESDERWGAYLALLGPGGGGTDAGLDLPGDEAIPEEPEFIDSCQQEGLPAEMDLGSLLRLLTTDSAPNGSNGAIAAEWAAEDDPPAAEPEPAADPEGVDFDWGCVESNGVERIVPDVLPYQDLPETKGPNAELWAPLLVLEPELREAFLADASDLFERIQTLVFDDLDRAETQAKAIRELSRCFHTLKGAAGSVGLIDYVTHIHELEDRLEEATRGAGPVPTDLLYQSIGNLENILFCLRQDNNAVPMPADLEATPVPDASFEAPAPSLPVGAQAEDDGAPSSPDPSSTPSEGWVRVPSARIDELMDLVSELITRRGLWAAQADTVKDFAATALAGRNRLMTSVDRLRDLSWPQGPTSPTGPDANDADGLARRLAEQAEDLAALADAARGAADPLADDADALGRLAMRLWDSLQTIRVVPVRSLFHRLARVAREAARVEDRNVEVVLLGEDVGMDRSVQDKAFEPLLHAVRNAVCHGIEPADQRVAAGKPPQGRVTLEARREGYTLVLKVQDDGRGLDHAAIAAQGRRLGLLGADEEVTPERLQALVFRPGFSTRQRADAIAGRGVGMDVVAQEVARLHGSVDLASQPGRGTTLTVRLPARMALEQAMVVRVAGRPFALPLSAIEVAQQFAPADEEGDGDGTATAVQVRGRSVRLLSARRALGLPAASSMERPKLLLVRAEGLELGLLVDTIEGPRELVIKPLGPLMSGHPVIAGTSMSPAGELILTIDPYGLVRHGAGAAEMVVPAAAEAERPRRVLVVDDAISVRRTVRRQLRVLRLETDEAADGVDALRRVRAGSYGLILIDLELPRMDGFELLAELRRSGVSEATPVVVISTRCDPHTLQRVMQLGARALLPKPITPDALAGAIAPLLPIDWTETPAAFSPAVESLTRGGR